MDVRTAEQLLGDSEVVSVLQATIPQGKELLAACLEADIPAVLGGGPGCGGGGCAPKVALYCRPEDVPRLQELLESRWRATLEQEGTYAAAPHDPSGADADGAVPCPACGTAAPLVDGACSDCGLQLA